MAVAPPPSTLLTRRQHEAVARLEKFIDELARGFEIRHPNICAVEVLVIYLPEAVDADVATELERRYVGAGWLSARFGEVPGHGWHIRLEALP